MLGIDAFTPEMLEKKRAAFFAYKKGAYAVTPLNGKIPVNKDWERTTFDPNTAWEYYRGRNFGIVLTSADIVIDVDPRNFAPDDDPFKRLLREFDFTDDDLSTFVVKTGAGGLHLYFRKDPQIPIRCKMKEFQGIDFRSAGGQVVGAGSIHPETNVQYEHIRGTTTAVKKIPFKLLDFLKRREDDVKNNDKSGLESYTDEDTFIVEKYQQYLSANAPLAIAGQNGNITTFKVACRGRELGLSPFKTEEMMHDYWNDRCQPPWSASELCTIVKNAYSYNSQPLGERHPSLEFKDKDKEEIKKGVLDLSDIGLGIIERFNNAATVDNTPLSEADYAEAISKWKSSVTWDLTKDGIPTRNLHNCVNYLSHPKFNVVGSIKFNLMGNRTEIWGKLPWEKELVKGDLGRGWGDTDTVHLKYFLSHTFQYEMNVNIIGEAVHLAANSRAYHPLREWLNSLVWDGKPRLEEWLIKCCGVIDNTYTRAVSKKVLVGAVARAFVPGIKMDYVLVLEGEQGIGKSTICSILGGEYYVDANLDPHSKDTVQMMQGRWIVELSEMECTKRAEVNALKAFISRGTDRLRLPYAEFISDIPRQSIFIGTINPDASAAYLKDRTGNRRFWPVLVHHVYFNALKEIRDQLFAEAVLKFKEGEKLYLDDPRARGIAVTAQYDRNECDPWEDPIAEWIGRREEEMGGELKDVTPYEIWAGCFCEPVHKLGRLEMTRIGECMKAIGWERVSVERKCKIIRGYKKRAVKEEEDFAILGELMGQ